MERLYTSESCIGPGSTPRASGGLARSLGAIPEAGRAPGFRGLARSLGNTPEAGRAEAGVYPNHAEVPVQRCGLQGMV